MFVCDAIEDERLTADDCGCVWAFHLNPVTNRNRIVFSCGRGLMTEVHSAIMATYTSDEYPTYWN